MSSKSPAFKQTTTQVALPEQSLKNEKRMKQVSAHACIYHGVAIICSVWVRAYLGNYKMDTAKSRILQPPFKNCSESFRTSRVLSLTRGVEKTPTDPRKVFPGKQTSKVLAFLEKNILKGGGVLPWGRITNPKLPRFPHCQKIDHMWTRQRSTSRYLIRFFFGIFFPTNPLRATSFFVCLRRLCLRRSPGVTEALRLSLSHTHTLSLFQVRSRPSLRFF